MSGTVNISRNIWNDTAFKPEPFTEREAWVWMIMEASYKPRKKPVGSIWVDLRRGQLSCSVRFMCDAWSWSKSRVDRFLKRLENRDMIGTESGIGVNVITICKYDDYQGSQVDFGTAKTEKRDSSGTAAGQQRDKPKKGVIHYARMEEERDTNVSLALFALEQKPPDRFEEFWDQYPHRGGAKKGKATAQKSWAKAIKDGATQSEIIAGAMRYAGDRQVIDGYAKNASTWINQRGWTDEIEPPAQTPPTRPGGGVFGGSSGPGASLVGIIARRELERRGGA